MAKDGGVDTSKRSLLTTMAGGGGLAMLAALIGPAISPALNAIAAGQSRPSPTNDIAIITDAIKLEQRAINTYQAAIQADLIKNPALLDVAVEFVNDHGNHRDALSFALRRNYKQLNGAMIKNLGTFP